MFLVFLTINTNAQKFGTLSGTIRFSGGLGGAAMIYSPMLTTWLLYEGFSSKGYGVTYSGWVRDNHLSFLRFFNAGYDFLYPQWFMSFSDENIKMEQTYAHSDNTFIDVFFTNDNYINYIGYYLNWKDPFSRYGFYCGIDYELRKFSLTYKSFSSNSYHYWHTRNEIQSLVPSVGLRYRLISPDKEVDGFPFNIVLEAGLSYAIVIKFNNEIDYYTDALNNYSTDALNNGFRAQLGIAITTNKWGSLYLRWNKDLYNFYNNDNIAKDKNGYLYNNTIKTNLSCFSFGWATFL